MTQPTPSKLSWRWRLWGRFMWLPQRAYYRLGDLLGVNKGWRPLNMRYPEHFPKKGRAV